MSANWHFLGKHAVTKDPRGSEREYVVVGKNVIGYAERDSDSSWTFYQFAPQEKGVFTGPEPVKKSSGKSAIEAVEIGFV